MLVYFMCIVMCYFCTLSPNIVILQSPDASEHYQFSMHCIFLRNVQTKTALYNGLFFFICVVLLKSWYQKHPGDTLT